MEVKRDGGSDGERTGRFNWKINSEAKQEHNMLFDRSLCLTVERVLTIFSIICITVLLLLKVK